MLKLAAIGMVIYMSFQTRIAIAEEIAIDCEFASTVDGHKVNLHFEIEADRTGMTVTGLVDKPAFLSSNTNSSSIATFMFSAQEIGWAVSLVDGRFMQDIVIDRTNGTIEMHRGRDDGGRHLAALGICQKSEMTKKAF